MWIDIPILKNTWTGEVEEQAINMDYVTRVTTYVPDDNVDLSLESEDSRRHYSSLKPMRSCLYLKDGGYVYSPLSRHDVQRAMKTAQAIAVTGIR